MDEGKSNTIEQTIRRMWVQFLPQLQERVTLMDTAARALADGACAPEQLNEAYLAAHKLAGVLGTLGLMDGTSLAREAEIVLGAGAVRATADCVRLEAIATELRRMIENRQ